MPEQAVEPPLYAAPDAAAGAATEAAQLSAFLDAPPKTVAGYTLHPFSAMRKAALQITGNELINMEEHLKAYCEANGRPVPEEGDPAIPELLLLAVPEAQYHIASLVFICVSDSSTLSKTTTSKDGFREAVFAFFDTLSDEVWAEMTAEAFALLAGERKNSEFTVKEDGAPPAKN